jgi:hypothetical protein
MLQLIRCSIGSIGLLGRLVDTSAARPSLVQPAFPSRVINTATRRSHEVVSLSPRGEDMVGDTVEWFSAETNVRAIAANAG